MSRCADRPSARSLQGELERLDGVAESAELSMARATVAEVKPLFE